METEDRGLRIEDGGNAAYWVFPPSHGFGAASPPSRGFGTARRDADEVRHQCRNPPKTDYHFAPFQKGLCTVRTEASGSEGASHGRVAQIERRGKKGRGRADGNVNSWIVGHFSRCCGSQTRAPGFGLYAFVGGREGWRPKGGNVAGLLPVLTTKLLIDNNVTV
jgi:hypothetical protein